MSEGRSLTGRSSGSPSNGSNWRRNRPTKRSRYPATARSGFITAFFATITGFALIWHIWWLVAVGVAAAYVVFVWFAWRDVTEYEIPAEEVARIDRARRAARQQWLAADAPAGGRHERDRCGRSGHARDVDPYLLGLAAGTAAVMS